jgi:hypothetical protein
MVPLVLQVQLVKTVWMEQLVQQDLKALQEIRVQQDQQDHKVQLEQQDLQVTMDQLVWMVLLDQQVPLEQLVKQA